jgi:MFS family permease
VPLFRALRHRNFRLFFGGQSVSLVGTWITRIATSWLVWRLTGSALLLGVTGFCSQIPALILSPISGVYVDRWNRHRVLIVTQALSLLQSLALAVLTRAGIITVPEVLGLQLLQGAINAFDTPARQAFLVHMIEDRADLPNAIALNSTMVNASRILGPSIGGALIAAVGEGWCFMLDAISYIAVIASLLAMRLPPAELRRATTRVREELAAGFRYVTRFGPVRATLLLLSLVSLAGMPYSTLMPDIATRILHGGAGTLGALMTASGCGALAGALYLATRRTVLGLGRTLATATLVFGLGLVAFSFTRSLPLALVLLPVVGAGFMVQMASANTLVQTIVTEELRGRVMAYYTMAFLGTAPIGALLGGIAAEHIGTPETVMAGGLACIAGGIWFGLRLPRLRTEVGPIYRRMGILGGEPAASTSRTSRP